MAWSPTAWTQSLDGVPVGATTPSTGKFTNLEATTQFKLGADTATTFDGINNNKVKAGSDGLDTTPGFLQDKINGGAGITVTVPVSGAVDQKLTISAQDLLSVKGDLLTYDGIGDVSLDVGTDGQVLTADSNTTEGIKWAGAGSLLQDTSFQNKARNGSFESWSLGTTSNPDGWALSGNLGGTGTVAEDTTNVRMDGASIKLTSTSGTASVIQDFSEYYFISSFEGRTFTMGAWIKSSTASSARINVTHNGATHFSSFHSGSGEFELLTVTVNPVNFIT